jgi:ribulose-phosphate 3-epimerase
MRSSLATPSWGGQAFLPAMLPKLRRLRDLAPTGTVLEVDGGVAEATAPDCREAGATLLVAGLGCLRRT